MNAPRHPRVVTAGMLAIPGAAVLVIAFGVAYIDEFQDHFTNTLYTRHPGWDRLLIPDTFLYRSISQAGDVGTWLNSGVKNSVGPAALWRITGGNYYAMFAVNVGLLLLVPRYFRSIWRALELDERRLRAQVFLATFAPSSIYFLFGSLKEIPTMVMLLAAINARLAGRSRRAIMWAGLLVAFRFQWLAIMAIFGLTLMLGSRPRRVVQLMFLFGALFPILPIILPRQLLVAETSAQFRAAQAGSGLGALVEQVRDNVPVLSAVALVARAFQSFLEPLRSFVGNGLSFNSDGSRPSVLLICYFLSALIMLVPVARLGKALVRQPSANHPTVAPQRSELLSFALVSFIIIGGGGIIHFRYLTPLFPMLLVASEIVRSRSSGEPLDNPRAGPVDGATRIPTRQVFR